MCLITERRFAERGHVIEIAETVTCVASKKTAKELLDSLSIVAEEIWPRNDNSSNLGLTNDNFSYFGVSGMTLFSGRD